MSILETMRSDVSRFRTADIMSAVVFAVVARVYALFASPVINAWLKSMGPVGQAISPFFTTILYFLILLSVVVRGSALVGFVAAMLMAAIRIFTGDPYGPIAIQAYLVGGLAGWIAFAATRNSFSYWGLAVMGIFFSIGVDFIFLGFYLPVAPMFGSQLAGKFVQIVGYRTIMGLVLGALLLYTGRWMQESEALRGVVRKTKD
jgi:hypothetical protein